MIIKSMSRKSRSFSQLFRYMKEGSSQNSKYDFFSKNLYSNKDKDITAEFLKNARLLKKRKNGNYLFHEVISLTRSKQLTLKQQKKRLFDIIRIYTEKRCNNNLVAGFLHDDKENNIHYHLMISSNEIGEPQNQRLPKHLFDKAKKEAEKYAISKYPELEQDILINANKNQKKAKKSKGEKRKGEKPDEKARIKETIKQIFFKSHSKQNFFERLTEENIELYIRGKTIGFINKEDNKKYRLKTLGLESEYQRIHTFMNEIIHTAEKEKKPFQDEIEKRKQEVRRVREKEERQKNKEKDRGFEP